jgi:hypothetical protein
MVIGALEAQLTQHTLHLFGPAPGKSSWLPTSTTSSRASLIAGVGIETLLDRGSGQLQDALPHGELQRFQIQVFHRLTTQQRFNLRNDLGGQ